jgi:ABC-type transport system involved in multi-copper enzyme maturation, permease component
MKTIFRIAKLELNTLFYSPIAWFLSVVFLFQCALAYTSVLQHLLTYQEIGGYQLKFLDYSTFQVFGLYGLYGDVLRKAYLYLPLLTMGLISREVNSGTIKLLYSSPVKISEIILGKFTAMVTYNLLLVAILLIFAISGMFNIKAADTGSIFPGIFSIFLLLCTYAAIGLFMSCLTSYQVVAAISTLVIFAALAFIGSIWQDMDVIRDLTYFLSISGRAERMIFGLLSTNHILYFVIIILMFLLFSMIKLRSGRETTSGLTLSGRYAGVFALALLAGYITSRPALIAYYDCTDVKTQTITPPTQKILRDLGDEPLEVTSYINLVDGFYRNGHRDQRNKDIERWEKYMRFKPNIKLKYVYYYDTPAAEMQLASQYPGKSLKQIAEQIAYSYKADLEDYKTPAEIRKVIDLSGEENRYVMQLNFKGKQTFLRLFNDNEVFPSETEVGAALKRLTVKLPKIVFATGEYERSKDKKGDTDYGIMVNLKTFRNALVNQGFDTDTLNLAVQDIPIDIAALVIADPKVPFSKIALEKIKQYLGNGGNALISGEPGRQSIINPVISDLGVQLMDGILVQKSEDNAPDLVNALLTPTSIKWSKSLNSAAKEGRGVSMSGATGLTYSKNGSFTVSSLLATDPKVSWLKKGKYVRDSTKIEFSDADGDKQESVSTALALTRNINGKQQRIIVAGDADFLSTAELKRFAGVNSDFGTSVFGWFTYGQFPIDTSRPEAPDDRINLSYKQLSAMRITYMGVLPGLLIVFAAIFLIRRKRK